MERRHIALERNQRRKEALHTAAPPSAAPPPPPPPPLDTPHSVSAATRRPQKRSTYGLQRDYRVLEREKKVTAVLENHGFRAELENILQGQLQGKTRPAPPTRPSPEQWLADLRNSALKPDTRQPVAGGGELRLPINDISGTLASKYTMAERQTRCKLAAVYRLVDIFGWAQLIYNHITARAPGGEGGYYANAFGLLYSEVTASNLVHVGLDGDIIDPGSTQLGVNSPGLHLHSAIHKCRPDMKCVIHLHNTATAAISVVNCGLLPISTEANAVGRVAYCDLWEVEREVMEDEIARTLETAEKVLILRNHGAMAMGASVEEALSVACDLVKACEIQVAAMSAGIGNLHTSPQGVWSRCRDGPTTTQATEGLAWKPGELQFEALMRMLDSKGYKTGYNYKSLDLLQPGKANKRQQEKRVSPNNSRERKAGDTEPPLATPTADSSPMKSPADPEKELWEYLAEERKIPEAALAKIGTRSKSTAVGPAEKPEGEDLDSLQSVAREVARSTRDAVQKITHRGKDLNPLEFTKETAERIAKSTGDALQKLSTTKDDPVSSCDLQRTVEGVAGSTADTRQGALLDMAQQTAERVARSTGQAVGRLATRPGELGAQQTQQTAGHGAESTGEVVKRLRYEDGDQIRLSPDLDRNGGLALESDQEPSVYPALHPSRPNPPAHFLRHASPKQTLLEQPLAPRTLNGTHRLLDHVPTHPAPAASEDVVTTPPAMTATNGNVSSLLPSHSSNTRRLPSLPPTTMLQHLNSAPSLSWGEPSSLVPSSPDRMRVLPSLPPLAVQPLPVPIQRSSKKPPLPTNTSPGTTTKSLTNGYHHSPLLLAHRFPRHDAHYDGGGSWTKFTDSESEYSTTESTELTQQLLAPAEFSSVSGYKETPSRTDLQTYPMLRMSHTAEMVAESTGKAVHKLTTTLA